MTCRELFRGVVWLVFCLLSGRAYRPAAGSREADERKLADLELSRWADDGGPCPSTD